MGSELCAVQASQSVLHVLSSEELDHSFTVTLHICETHVSGLTHMVFQILPAAGGRKPRHNNAKLRSARRRSKPSPWSSSSASSSSRRSTKFGSGRSWIFHTQLTISKPISIPPKDGVLCIPWILKPHEGKRDGASVVLQLNIPNFSVFEEEILNVPLLDVHGKVSHVDPSV